MRKGVFFISLAVMLFSVATQALAETLDEYKERTKKEQEEIANAEEEETDEGCNPMGACCQVGLNSGCLDAFSQAFFTIFAQARYADYPFAPQNDFYYSTFVEPGEEVKAGLAKIWMVELAFDGAWLFGQELPIYSLQALARLDILAFHLNLFYQYLLDAQGTGLSTFSANGGIAMPLGNFTIDLYCGVFLQEGWPAYFSWGMALKIFFGPGITFSLYSLFAVYEPFYFIILLPSLEVVLNRFSLGLGFNVLDYNDLLLYGPTLKLGLWF